MNTQEQLTSGIVNDLNVTKERFRDIPAIGVVIDYAARNLTNTRPDTSDGFMTGRSIYDTGEGLPQTRLTVGQRNQRTVDVTKEIRNKDGIVRERVTFNRDLSESESKVVYELTVFRYSDPTSRVLSPVASVGPDVLTGNTTQPLTIWKRDSQTLSTVTHDISSLPLFARELV